ncbi:MAG: pseudouridine synthase [Pseudomonadota bacterium]
MTQGTRRNRSSYNARANGRLSSQESDRKTGHRPVAKNNFRPASHEGPTENISHADTVHQEEQGMRLNKALASAGICSRRQADVLIERGSVMVNGHVVTEMGCKVHIAQDDITVDGHPLPRAHQSNHSGDTGPKRFGPQTYLLINKPVQVVTTVRDPQGRQTVIDLVPSQFRKQRLFPVGRLDFFSEGLLLLTNDGELTNRLTHPRWHLPKVYEVRVRGDVTLEKLHAMRHGMRLAEGELLAPVEVERIWADRSSAVLELTLHQGINRQIRRMCRDLDLVVLRLRRVAQGPLQLGNLELGQCRTLTNTEVQALRRAVSLD